MSPDDITVDTVVPPIPKGKDLIAEPDRKVYKEKDSKLKEKIFKMKDEKVLLLKFVESYSR